MNAIVCKEVSVKTSPCFQENTVMFPEKDVYVFLTTLRDFFNILSSLLLQCFILFAGKNACENKTVKVCNNKIYFYIYRCEYFYMAEGSDLKLFNELFTTYQGRFTHFANTYVRNQAVAEDLTIESFMYYWENRHSLSSETNIPAYILTSIKHKCLNYLQHVQVREEAAEYIRKHAEWELHTRITTLEDCNPNELFSAEAMRIVNDTLATLPEASRKVFIMSRFENKSYKEIAETMGITPKGVEFHIAKVLRELRKNLKDYFPFLLYFLQNP